MKKLAKDPGIEERLQINLAAVGEMSGEPLDISLQKLLEEQGCRAVMVENCGMKTEQVYGDLKEIPEDAGYFSLLVAR